MWVGTGVLDNWIVEEARKHRYNVWGGLCTIGFVPVENQQQIQKNGAIVNVLVEDWKENGMNDYIE